MAEPGILSGNFFWPLQTAKAQYMQVPLRTADFTGKKIIVTGANGGLGLEASRHFVRLGAATVVLACRNVEAAERAKADIESTTGRTGVVRVWHVDLQSFESVKELCRRAERELDRLDVLLLNAAVWTLHYEVVDGHETTVIVNVISPMLMAFMLLPLMRQTAVKFNVTPHITTLSSDAHRAALLSEKSQPNVFEALRADTNQHDRYPLSKLLILLLTRALAEELGPDSSVVANVVNPGICDTAVFRFIIWPFSIVWKGLAGVFGRTAEVGSRTLVHGAHAGRASHGKFLDTCRAVPPRPLVRSEEGKRLQARVYAELKEVLEEVEPGVSKI